MRNDLNVDTARVATVLRLLCESIADSLDDEGMDAVASMLGIERGNLAVLTDAVVRSYALAGIMTTDDGFVLRLTDRSEYQVTVVRSR